MRSRFRGWCRAVLPCVTLALLVAPAAAQEAASPLEVGLKAAFLYKFTGYVEWPDLGADAPLSIGVIGDDAVADELGKIVRDRTTAARGVTVVRLRPFEPLPRLHVLFIGHSESDRLAALARIARANPVLVVTDTDGALALGSMINFVVVDGHMRFEVGLGSAKRAGISLSSRLLAVAQTVTRRTP